MRIKTAHKILIASTIAFFFFFGIWKVRDYAASGSLWALGGALVSALVAVGFGIYYRSLKWKEF